MEVREFDIARTQISHIREDDDPYSTTQALITLYQFQADRTTALAILDEIHCNLAKTKSTFYLLPLYCLLAKAHQHRREHEQAEINF